MKFCEPVKNMKDFNQRVFSSALLSAGTVESKSAFQNHSNNLFGTLKISCTQNNDLVLLACVSAVTKRPDRVALNEAQIDHGNKLKEAVEPAGR